MVERKVFTKNTSNASITETLLANVIFFFKFVLHVAGDVCPMGKAEERGKYE